MSGFPTEPPSLQERPGNPLEIEVAAYKSNTVSNMFAIVNLPATVVVPYDWCQNGYFPTGWALEANSWPQWKEEEQSWLAGPGVHADRQSKAKPCGRLEPRARAVSTQQAREGPHLTGQAWEGSRQERRWG